MLLNQLEAESQPLKENNLHIIYRAKNIINGKSYIGQTNNFRKRKNDHISCAKRGHKGVFYNAIRKYGEDSFVWEILDSVDCIEEANKLEVCFISRFNSLSHDFGYNIQIGGDNHKGYRHTSEAKAKISEASRGNKNTLGYRHSEEAKAKIGEAALGNKYAKTRPVYCVETGVVYDTIADATLAMTNGKRTRSHIGCVASGKKNFNTCFGYTWRFLEDL